MIAVTCDTTVALATCGGIGKTNVSVCGLPHDSFRFWSGDSTSATYGQLAAFSAHIPMEALAHIPMEALLPDLENVGDSSLGSWGQ